MFYNEGEMYDMQALLQYTVLAQLIRGPKCPLYSGLSLIAMFLLYNIL